MICEQPSNWLKIIGTSPIIVFGSLSLTDKPTDPDGSEIAVNIYKPDDGSNLFVKGYTSKYADDVAAQLSTEKNIHLSLIGQKNVAPTSEVSTFVIILISLQLADLGDLILFKRLASAG
jgi:hypothetical protein